jgi:hypothetical protein
MALGETLTVPDRAEQYEDPPWKGPIYFYWVYLPDSSTVLLDHNNDRHRAYAITHGDLLPERTDALWGYAYKIKGGYRITNVEHKAVDPWLKQTVFNALQDWSDPEPGCEGRLPGPTA